MLEEYDGLSTLPARVEHYALDQFVLREALETLNGSSSSRLAIAVEVSDAKRPKVRVNRHLALIREKDGGELELQVHGYMSLEHYDLCQTAAELLQAVPTREKDSRLRWRTSVELQDHADLLTWLSRYVFKVIRLEG